MVDFKKLASMSAEERKEAILAREARNEKDRTDYLTILMDADKSPRLNDWEKSFIASLRNKLDLGLLTTKAELSEKQLGKLLQLEEKIYATG